ncbi:MAG: tyrosine-type recombinase/integrase [Patescibacteria group bacterium]
MIPLKTAHKSFVEHLKKNNRSDATIIAYSKDVEQLSDYLLKKGRDLVHEVILEDLKEYMKKLTGENLTPKTISRKTNSTKTFFKYLKVEGHVENDPAQDLAHPKVDPKAPRILSKVEYRALRDACKNDKRTLAIVELLLQTGIRIGELAKLKITDATFGEDGVLKVPFLGTHPTRQVPLNTAAQKAIKDYLEIRGDVNNEHLFITKSGNPLLIRNIRATIDRYFKLAGIENAKVNDLRHTFVAHHLKEGASIVLLSKIAGHKRISTTEKYLEYVERNGEEKAELSEL